MTSTNTYEIELQKEVNGMIFILTGDLDVDYYESPYNEHDPSFNNEEVNRTLTSPWLTVLSAEGEEIWDRVPHNAQLRLFKEDIEAYEINL